MALNDESFPAELESEENSSHTRTVVGLFEDMLDMRAALEGLRKSDCQPDYVSIIVYDRQASEGPASERHGGVAHAVALSELNSVAQWLTRLTSLVVPERGAFLVSGPFGVTLAGLNTKRADIDPPAASALALTLCGFGFGEDEAMYIDHRLTAGSSLVGVSCADDDLASATQEQFGDGNAVYLGVATSNQHHATNVADLLVAPPELFAESDVVVTDAVAQLSGLCGSTHPLARLCGQSVVDRDGQGVGMLEEIIAESIQASDSSPKHLEPRYLIVTHGGVLGIGRKRTAVPVSCADLHDAPVMIAADRDTIQSAPVWDAEAPFSRRDEQLICAYFGAPPH